MKELFWYIKSDFARIDNPTFWRFIKTYLFPQGNMIRYLVWMRVIQYTKQKRIIKYTIGLLAYAIFRHYEYKYGIHINTNILIGPGLHIVHGDGVYLNVSRIGKNFTCYQGVTCGEKNGIPWIGDDVTIYTNAVVVGEICLGDFSVVGANSYVDFNLSNGEIAIGVKAHTRS